MTTTHAPAAVDDEHPVWEVYDLLRTARLNEGYYSTKLRRLTRRQRAIDIIIAVAAPTSAVAAWNQDAAWIPEAVRPFVKPAWAGFAGVASILALANPFLRLSESISKLEACVTEYRSIGAELEELRSEINLRRAYDARLQEWFRYVRQRRRRASEHEPNDPVDTRLRKRMESGSCKSYPVPRSTCHRWRARQMPREPRRERPPERPPQRPERPERPDPHERFERDPRPDRDGDTSHPNTIEPSQPWPRRGQ